MQDNKQDNKQNNKPTSGNSHNGRHNNKHNHHRRPRSKDPSKADGNTVVETLTPPTDSASSIAETANADNFKPRHNHQNGKQGHKNNRHKQHQNHNERKTQQTAEPEPSTDNASQAQTSVAPSSHPARSVTRPSASNDAPPEVIFIDEPNINEAPSKDLGVKIGDPDFSAFDFDAPNTDTSHIDDAENGIEVVGVRFRKSGKVYYFSPEGASLTRGMHVIVETARGPEYGEVWMANKVVAEKNIVQPLRPVIRVTTPEDDEHNTSNRQREKEAFGICREKIAKHGLDMKLVEAQYTFDNSKLLFYFTSAGRVDFRELVKDLASVFRTRIELRQIGIRDESKLLGGLGACGRPLCCASFLSDFVQVSIKMAKEQNLSLNSNKISGTCGRLMCCLRYENSTYEEEIRKTPPVESVVRTPDGNGVVTEISPLSGMIKVRISDKQDTTVIKAFHRDDVTVISRPRPTETESETDSEN